MLSIMVILLPIMGVYTGLARLNYQKEEWVVHYSRPLNLLTCHSLYLYLYTYIYIYMCDKTTVVLVSIANYCDKSCY